MDRIQEEFNEFYRTSLGDRWLLVLDALRKPERQVRRYNIFASKDIANIRNSVTTPEIMKDKCVSGLPWLPEAAWHEGNIEIPRGDNQLLSYYIMDPASALVAENLNVVPGEKILDVCAAPGGKSLILAQRLFFEDHPNSELILNEISMKRRERLKKVIQNYIPREKRDRLWIKGKDGVRFGLESKNYFDAILLDAPCSGERHLVADQSELKNWSIKRTKHLAQKQYSLLASSVMALKPGGRLMYSTCALSPLENDEVIERLFKKKKNVRIEKLKYQAPGFEKTKFGVQYWPDQIGFGPMYSALLSRLL